jgi:hypothetical protein
LTNPGKPISSLELDPPPPEDTERPRRFVISEEDYYKEFGDVEWSEARQGFYAPVADEGLVALNEQIESLKRQIEVESDKAELKRLKDILKKTNTSFNEQFRSVQKETNSARAFRRVKGAMWDARHAMEKSKSLPEFLGHLDRSFQEMGQGHRYEPKPVVNWKT